MCLEVKKYYLNEDFTPIERNLYSEPEFLYSVWFQIPEIACNGCLRWLPFNPKRYHLEKAPYRFLNNPRSTYLPSNLEATKKPFSYPEVVLYGNPNDIEQLVEEDIRKLRVVCLLKDEIKRTTYYGTPDFRMQTVTDIKEIKTGLKENSLLGWLIPFWRLIEEPGDLLKKQWKVMNTPYNYTWQGEGRILLVPRDIERVDALKMKFILKR